MCIHMYTLLYMRYPQRFAHAPRRAALAAKEQAGERNESVTPCGSEV